MRPKRLGRGLGNLLGATPETTSPDAVERRSFSPPEAADAAREGAEIGTRALPVGEIRRNPFQPRTAFAEEALDELASSIREHGVIQPVVVRPSPTGGWELIAGERRLRAAERIGLDRIPALVRRASDEEMQTLALVENLQREDLNAMEKARAMNAMLRNFGLTQEDVARRVGKARTTIANILRLLDLPSEIQAWVEEGRLSGAHARALLQAQGTERRLSLARLAVERGLSVREIERRARSGPTVGRRRARGEDPYLRDLETRLERSLSTQVRIRTQGKSGRIEVHYHDPDDLDRLLERLGA